jgi:hypothetical protein
MEDYPEVIEAEYEQTDLDVAKTTGIVRAAGDVSLAMAEYTKVKNTLDRALPDCIMSIRGKQFRKKNYWRAVATAFNLDVICIGKDKVELPNGDWGVEVTYRATAPNGRCADGDGACMASEKSGNMATYHNVRAHAHTRGFNRAVSNLVGFGEVSFDELTDEAKGYSPRPAAPAAAAPAPAQKRTYTNGARSAGMPAKCPDCGGTEFWDNRADKPSPRHPDFKCKNRDCKKAFWVNSKQDNAKEARQESSSNESLKSVFDMGSDDGGQDDGASIF